MHVVYSSFTISSPMASSRRSRSRSPTPRSRSRSRSPVLTVQKTLPFSIAPPPPRKRVVLQPLRTTLDDFDAEWHPIILKYLFDRLPPLQPTCPEVTAPFLAIVKRCC